MIVMVTNCIGYGVPIAPERLWLGRVHHSLFSAGLIRLLKGNGFAPAGPWPPKFTFAPINLADVEALVWSPFIDQTGYYPQVLCQDGSIYPYSDTDMVSAVGNGPHPALSDVYQWWRELDALTACVPRRILVLYPTTSLDSLTESHGALRKRVLDSTAVARQTFTTWTPETVEHPVVDLSGWWAHLLHESKVPMLNRIAALCAPVHTATP